MKGKFALLIEPPSVKCEVLRFASLKPELQQNNHQRFLSHLPLPPYIAIAWSYTASLLLRGLLPQMVNPGRHPPSAGYTIRATQLGFSFTAGRNLACPAVMFLPRSLPSTFIPLG